MSDLDDNRDAVDEFTGTRYVPADYTGELARCAKCGWPAPRRELDGHGRHMVECSSCFVGATALRTVTIGEVDQLIAELGAHREDLLRGHWTPRKEPELTTYDDVNAVLNVQLDRRDDVKGNVLTLTLKALGLYIQTAYPTAVALIIEDGDQGEYDVNATGMLDAQGAEVESDEDYVSDDDTISELVMQLLSYQLNSSPVVQVLGDRRNGRWSVSVAAAAALPMPS